MNARLLMFSILGLKLGFCAALKRFPDLCVLFFVPVAIAQVCACVVEQSTSSCESRYGDVDCRSHFGCS